jgi:hypothetical protein
MQLKATGNEVCPPGRTAPITSLLRRAWEHGPCDREQPITGKPSSITATSNMCASLS